MVAAARSAVLLVDDHALLRTGVANIIVQPDFYDQERLTIVGAPFMIVEGIVQTIDDVTAIKAEKVFKLEGLSADAAIESHDFH